MVKSIIFFQRYRIRQPRICSHYGGMPWRISAPTLTAGRRTMLEQILTDIQKADPEWNVILLRYFNPIGAHKSGTIGENPNGIPQQPDALYHTGSSRQAERAVFGDDYDTDGNRCGRDYIHVVDLAKGHVKALKKIERMQD